MKTTEVVPGSTGTDPNRAFAYLVAGVLLYGGLGWLLDRWWDTGFMVVLGILLGAGLGMFMVFRTFGYRPGSEQTSEPEDS